MQISLDFPNEHLSQVKGTTSKGGFLGSNRFITSLTFITNKQSYGPYGLHKGAEFTSYSHRLVTGFYGKADDATLHQFGVFATTSADATDRYLHVDREGFSWGKLIRKEVSSAGKFLQHEMGSFGKLPPLGFNLSPKQPKKSSEAVWKP